jgi:hypothetical protein
MPKIKEESWSLTSADTIAIPATNRADGVANVWSDIWKYQVPTGQAHILKPSHRISFYGASAGPVEHVATTKVRILIRDQSEQDEITIYGPSLYVASKEFQDVRKMAYLMLPSERPVEEMFFIVVQTLSVLPTDESASYFRLETTRIRNTI